MCGLRLCHRLGRTMRLTVLVACLTVLSWLNLTSWLNFTESAWAAALRPFAVQFSEHSLAERLADFPRWSGVPTLRPAQADLVYPAWFAGEWQVTSTLVEQLAPLQSQIVSPGFESNRRWLNQPVTFTVRFVRNAQGEVVADRQFNSLSLARTYLGQETVIDVKLDPTSVNRQVTRFRIACLEQKSCERQLVTVITQRQTEMPQPQEFITGELSQQEFVGLDQPYFNVVENTSDYTYTADAAYPIQANQITAIYLSPQDADYFQAQGRPVALYRYRLEFIPAQARKSHV